ncbi:hypothetical protein OB971_10775 [Bacillus cereus]|uniref:hypothetical protein n=1 Tax=Bacillus cereus group TaxID=86661 RepID=UPI001F5946CD|nr:MULTISPECIES: hypothetical protein [Bacillus cereus group]MCU4795593.1 hypothetical protein [Bacillus cereus]MCU5532331.1 hypothetical protein [Bacillus cereus]MDA2006004.1 hypothetical protein [Bacillus cereus]MDA2617500.1 hypothetical protein [Bacillus cereus]MDF9476770.1 hypothetical protein [Bacillus cereus]
MKRILVLLLGAIFNCSVAIYIALCPILNQELRITTLVIWKQAKYQLFGLAFISIILILTLILQYHIQKLWSEYQYWLRDQMVKNYIDYVSA